MFLSHCKVQLAPCSSLVPMCFFHSSSTKWLLLILSAGYLVLEGYGGPGESSTDDDILASTTGKQLRTSQGCAADSGINLRFSSASQAGSLSSFSRQVLSHLRNLQANLNYLKVSNSHWEYLHTGVFFFIAWSDSELFVSLAGGWGQVQ